MGDTTLEYLGKWLLQNTHKTNRLSGSVVLTQLPSSLYLLFLSNNQFSGALDLTRLPSSMSVLELDNNSFSGTVDLSQLPQGRLYLSDNALSGEVFSDALFDDVYVEDTKIIKWIIHSHRI
ncbi:hypothetical protein XU18_1321 [Perkinsela sp. CCAP 1560/4]|nr:hypothetical protein XU18_1321 [Perkinsela sp. CCAP 1560/4]|eukprot:KNH08105.1 hypothetical protein XU18_1321 [Perkinsela sp. CCAP 1560/4]